MVIRKMILQGKGKKGYVRTMEAAVAIALSFIFIIYFVPSDSVTEQEDAELDLIGVMEQNTRFRNCVIEENHSCLNSLFERYYPHVAADYDYVFNVSTDPQQSGVSLPPKNIHTESLMIAGNDTYIRPKTVRLYYWLE
ncbi:MAG: hypothetical protein R6U32_02680 [Candidatus Woesearchaeota archaeon]